MAPAYLTVLVVAITVACGGGGTAAPAIDEVPAATGVPEPDAEMVAPTPFAATDDPFADVDSGMDAEVRLADPTVAAVVEALGFALAPLTLPTGFELDRAEVLQFPTAITARHVYRAADGGGDGNELHLTYPMRFTPNGDSFFEGAGFEVPDDVMDTISVASSEAYLIKGGWDPDSMRILQPYLARWDYDRSLTVMFVYDETPAGPVWVAVRADRPAAWTTAAELVRIAESVRQVE